MSVLDLLPDGLQQPGVVGGGGDGLRAHVLHGAEGLRAQAQVVETLLQEGVGTAGPLGVYAGSQNNLKNHAGFNLHPTLLII